MTNAAAVIIRVRIPAIAACVSGLIAAAVLVAVPAAQADTGYRYWSYWYGTDGAWTYATEGSGTRIPADGDVEGWRFGIAGNEDFIRPSVPADFESICSHQEEVEGSKRVAIVIDPGSPSEAPEGEERRAIRTECVVAKANATGYQMLAQIADVRTDAGFVCGLDGYPASECAPLVEVSAAQEADPSTSEPAAVTAADQSAPAESVEPGTAAGPGTPLVSAAAISLLALAGFGMWRRRRHSQSTESV